MGCNIYKQDDKADKVNPKILMNIVLNNISDDLNPFSSWEFDSDKIRNNFHEVKDKTADLYPFHHRIFSIQKVLEHKGYRVYQQKCNYLNNA